MLRDFPAESSPLPAVAAPLAEALPEPTKEEIESFSDISPSASLKGKAKSSKFEKEENFKAQGSSQNPHERIARRK